MLFFDNRTGFISRTAPLHSLSSNTMTITLNGTAKEVPDTATILTLLADSNLSPQKVAVELNKRLLRTERYAEPLNPGDEVEIVTFVGGG